MSMELIETIEVGAGGAASIEFTSIPQDGVDLLLMVSVTVDTLYQRRQLLLHFNGETSGTNYSQITLEGSGSGVLSFADTSQNRIVFRTSSETSNTFNSSGLFISNYASSNAKSISIDSVTENNATRAHQEITAAKWANTSAITSIAISDSSLDFAQYSTASLFKIS